MGAQQRTGPLTNVNVHGIYMSRPTGGGKRTGERRVHLLIQVPELAELFRQGTFGNVKREREKLLVLDVGVSPAKKEKFQHSYQLFKVFLPFHHRPPTFLIRNSMLGNVLTLLSAPVPPGLSYQVLIPSKALPELLAYLTRQAGKPRGGSEQPL